MKQVEAHFGKEYKYIPRSNFYLLAAVDSCKWDRENIEKEQTDSIAKEMFTGITIKKNGKKWT